MVTRQHGDPCLLTCDLRPPQHEKWGLGLIKVTVLRALGLANLPSPGEGILRNRAWQGLVLFE